MDKQKIAGFADRVFQDISSFFAVGLAYLGTKTGLLALLGGAGPLSIEAVVKASGLQPTYVEAWLRGMVTVGYLEYDPEGETFALPPEHGFLLASEGTDHYLGGIFYQAQANMAVADRVAAAFKEGGGVPFADYGPDNLTGLDLANRGIYERRFADYWLSQLPGVVARLQAGGSALDVGCGSGTVSTALARAFPQSRFVGVDLDPESIRKARAGAEGLGGRVRFVDQPLAALPPEEVFDLITVCDAVHDFAAPLETLREIRQRLKPGGVFLVVEPRVADHLEDNCNPVGAMFHGFSLFH